MKWFRWIISPVFWKWIFRLGLLGVVIAIIAAIPVALTLMKWSKDLPSVETLQAYKPPVTTRVHAGDGKLIAEFARESRIFVPIEIVPERVKYAFIDSEDKNFYHHTGVDYVGTLKAVIRTVRAKLDGSGGMFGGSTITQQVAKNFLVGDDRDLRRKWREALVARKMEKLYSKDEILELYLNEIYLGNRSYGLGAAALSYFGKSMEELTVSEMAYLGGLPQRPSRLHPVRHEEAAIGRRNYVIQRMLVQGHISAEEAQEARLAPLEVVDRFDGEKFDAAEYFVEEIRRQIAEQYGEEALYNGGLSIRTTIDTNMQLMARDALRAGLEDYDRDEGFRGPAASMEDEPENWAQALADYKMPSDLDSWQPAVLSRHVGRDAKLPIFSIVKPEEIPQISEIDDDANDDDITISLQDITLSTDAQKFLNSYDQEMAIGDVVYVQQLEIVAGDEAEKAATIEYDLKQVPSVNGALVAMDPHTGRVLAMMGGFSFAQSQFNRVTQAQRQPGSAFKPFVYAAALDNGYTPSSKLLDTPFVDVDPHTGKVYKPKNYSFGWLGEATMRVGLEKSRNMMTVRLARDIGMDRVVDYGIRLGIYDRLEPYLPMSLGAGETSLIRLTSAYGMIVNGGKKIKPVTIDRVQNREGETVARWDERDCSECNQLRYFDGEPPQIAEIRAQVVDPITAYQLVAMMQGAVERGISKKVAAVGKILAGKTGTTNEYRDAWFVGFSPDLVVGVYVGFDTPIPMGQGQGGGNLAAPIFRDFMKAALADQADIPFRIPSGVRLVRVDARTGEIASADSEHILLEPFRPGTEPARTDGDGFGWPVGGSNPDSAVSTGSAPANGDSKFGYGVDIVDEPGIRPGAGNIPNGQLDPEPASSHGNIQPIGSQNPGMGSTDPLLSGAALPNPSEEEPEPDEDFAEY